MNINVFKNETRAKVDADYLNGKFAKYGFRFTHNDDLRESAQFFFVDHEDVRGRLLYIYAAAQEKNNLTHKGHLNDHYINGILCFRSEEFYDQDSHEFASFMPPDAVNTNGYVYFGDDLTSIEEVAHLMLSKLLDATA